MAFVYKRKSFNQAAKEADEISTQGDFHPLFVKPDDSKIVWFKPRNGENIVRILPPTSDEMTSWYHTLTAHNGVGRGAGGGKFGERMLCLGDDCPMCKDYTDKTEDANGDKDKEQEARQLASRQMRFTYVLDRDDVEKGIQLWAVPKGIADDIIKISIDRRRNRVMYVDDPEDGYDIIFDRKGAGLKTEYSGVKLDSISTPLDNDEAISAAVEYSLPSLVKSYTPDQCKLVMGIKPKPDNSTNTRDDQPSNEEVKDKPSKQPTPASKRDLPTMDDMTFSELSKLADTLDIDISIFDPTELNDIRTWITANS